MPLDRNVTDIICASSVQRLHLTMEDFPVGLIVVDQNASIVSIDKCSERLLEFEEDGVKGRLITTIFGDAARNWFTKLRSSEKSAYLGCLHIITTAGMKLKLEIAMAPSMVPHQNTLHVVFALDN
jgi:hypothetical protein